MKKLLVCSVLLNVGLAIALALNAYWNSGVVHGLLEGLEREGEFQAKMYAMSLSALESEDQAEKEQTAHFLRLYIKNWEEGAETRQRMREVFE